MEVRAYQAVAFIQALTHPGWRHGYVCWDTGAGKSVLTRMILTYWMARQSSISHGLIMSPFTTTRGGFVKDGEGARTFDFNGARDELPPNFISALDELVPGGQLVMPEGLIREGTRREMPSYFSNPEPGYILSVCNQSAVMFDEWPTDMRRMAVVFDEYQWKGARAMSEMAAVIESRGLPRGGDLSEIDLDSDTETNIRGGEGVLQDHGCRTLNLSATPWRHDHVPTQPDDLSNPSLFVTFRTLPEQIADGYSPRVTFSITPIDVLGDTLEERVDNLAAEVARVPTDPGHKSIVRIKPRAGRDCDGLTIAHRIRNRLSEHWGDRGRDATDYHPDNPAAFRAFLDRERGRNDFNDSEADHSFGVNVPITGMDWRGANLGISIGLIRSTASIVQFVGRLTRYKGDIANYPPQFLNNVEAKFLVPLVPNEPQANFIENQSENLARTMVKVSLILSQTTLPDAFKAHNIVRDTLFQVLGATRDRVGPRQVRSNIRARVLRDLILLLQEGMLLGEYREILLRRFAGRDDVDDQDIDEALIQAWAAQASPEELARMRAILDLEQNRIRIRDAFDPTSEAFKILVEEFREEGINFRTNPLLVDVPELYSTLDHILTTHWSRRFVEVRTALSVEHIVRCWRFAWERNGQFPTSGVVEEAPSWTWETLEVAVQNGSVTCGLNRSYPSIEELVMGHCIDDSTLITHFNFLYDEGRVQCVENVDFSDPDYWVDPTMTAPTQRWMYRRYIRARDSMPRSLNGGRVLLQLCLSLGATSVLRHFRSSQNRRFVVGTPLRFWSDTARRLEAGEPVTDDMVRNLVQNRPLDAGQDAAE